MAASQALVIVVNRIGAVLLPDNQQWTNRIEIKSSSSTRLYVVAQRKTSGEWACSCPGWKRYRYCKHLSAMTPMLIDVRSAPTSQIETK